MQKTISVFFSGTGFSIQSPNFLAASLYGRTQENEQHIKMGFDGCGVLYPFRGTIFGSGLDEQSDEAIQRILNEIEAGNKVTLNVYGHSRGAIGALLLAQQLGSVDPDKLSINLALLDPVPGNLITTSTLDPLNISLANKTMDLTGCKPLKKVLALYPHVPLPATAFHAPLFITYPQGIELEEDAMAGCHAQAENLLDPASQMTKLRIEEFLAQNGTKFDSSVDYTNSERLKELYILEYETALKNLQTAGTSFTRDTHSAKGVYINTKVDAPYFNEHHKLLAGGAKNARVALTIEQSYGPVSLFKRITTAYPIAWQILKWTFLSLSLASLLFFTGGLAAIPAIAAVVAQLGILSSVAAAPIVGGALATLWYGVIKPASLWAVNRFFYPMFSIREIVPSSPNIKINSTEKMLDDLDASSTVPQQPRPADQPYYEAVSRGKHRAEHGKSFFSSSQPSQKSSDIAESYTCT